MDDMKVISRQNNSILIGKIKDQTLLAEFYSLADAFVICSERENFPTTCVEAQCCGTPITGFDTGGTRETALFSHEKFCQYGDIKSLRDQIKVLLAQDKTEEISSRAEQVYSKEAMYRRYEELYARMGGTGKQLKILLLDVNCKYSSTGKIVYDLFTNLRENGQRAALCYGRGPLVEEKGIYKFGLDWETYFHAGLARITGFNGCFSLLSTLRLLRFLDQFKPDVVHIHELHAYFVNIGMLVRYLKKRKIKIVWTFHCEYMYTGKCGYANECRKYEKECGRCPELHEYPKSLLFDQTKHMFRMKRRMFSDLEVIIACPSQWLADRAARSFLKDKKIVVVHNGVDTEIFRPVDSGGLRHELGIPEDNKVVLSVAPDIMSERKGGRWVLQAAEGMREEKITFVLVGVEAGSIDLTAAAGHMHRR